MSELSFISELKEKKVNDEVYSRPQAVKSIKPLQKNHSGIESNIQCVANREQGYTSPRNVHLKLIIGLFLGI